MSKKLFLETDDKSLLRPMSLQDNMGYSPMRSESVNRSRPTELKEAFNVRFPPVHQNDLRACPDGFGPYVDEFEGLLKDLTRRYMIACEVALGLPFGFFTKTLKSYDLCTLRMLHYPPCDFESTAGAALNKPLRIGEHTDFGAVTFLFLGENGPDGLQIKPVQGGECGGVAGGEDQGWRDVELPKDIYTNGVIVNSGALMARWTNDEWCATAHRVVVKDPEMASRSRYSIAFFVDPDKDSVVEVHERFCQNGQTQKYAPVSSYEYLRSKLKSMLEPEATEEPNDK